MDNQLRSCVVGDKITMNGNVYIRSFFSGKMFWVDIKTGLTYSTNDIERISTNFKYPIDFMLED